MDLFKKRDPEYNIHIEIFKPVYADKGRRIDYEEAPIIKSDMCKILGFETQYIVQNGHTESRRIGTLEILDLQDGDIKPDYKVQIGEKAYIVNKVSYADSAMQNKQKLYRKQVSNGLTTLIVRSA